MQETQPVKPRKPSPPRRIFRFLRYDLARHPVARNTLSLYGVQFAGYLLPLITVPYLARVLHPQGLGLVVFAQSFALWVILFLEYGFNLSATREVARRKHDPHQIADIVAAVMGAKILLCGMVLLATCLAWPLAPIFHAHPQYLLWSLLVTLVSGFSPLWYFQGTEQLTKPASVDILSRGITTLGVILLVRTAHDGWMVLALQALGSIMSTGLLLTWMYRHVRYRTTTGHAVIDTLRGGWNMFLFRSAASLYTVANVFLLGMFVSPVMVGFYGGAEKISRAALGLLNPISQALYPRMSHLTAQNPARASWVSRMSFCMIGGFGLALGALLALSARTLVQTLLGPGYDTAVPLLRILSLLLPLIALSNVLGIQRMLPLGLDRSFSVIVISAGLLNVLLACILVPYCGPIGMAWSVVVAEALVSGSMYVVLWRHGAAPFSQQAADRDDCRVA
jgi:PST family polysaccharide transporter